MKRLASFLLLPGVLVACHSATERAAAPPAKPAAPCPPPAPFVVRHPAWAANASLYQVNVRQYTPEGTFRAFEAHLPRLQKMGVGILWLMPVQPIGVLKRKGTLGSQYSVRDYRAVNPEFGTLADLRHLVQEAHKRHMHVILDWVANHTSWDNPLLKQHPDWYTRDANGNFQPPVADWQDVVDLDYGNPALRRYMTDALKFWLRKADVDGFRADVAGLVPTDYWNDARRELQRVKPVFLLAEWDELHDPPFLRPGEFTPNTHLLERAFDATYALRLHYLLDSLAQGKKPLSALRAYLAAERRRYPPGVYLMNFTSSHDVNSWDGPESQRLGADAEPLAVLAALLPGIPLVYSGQEARLSKKLRFFDKDTIDWRNYPLHDFYTALLQLKRRHPALLNGDACATLTVLPASEGCFAFVRQKDDAAVVVVLNLTNQAQTVVLPALPGAFHELFTGQTLRLAAPTGQSLMPHGYGVWTTPVPTDAAVAIR